MSVELTASGIKFTALGEADADAGNVENVVVTTNISESYEGDIKELVNVGVDGSGTVEWGEAKSEYGEFVTNADGTWSFVPDKEKIATITKGELVSQELSYTCRDADGDEISGTIKFDIAGTNKVWREASLSFSEESLDFYEKNLASGTDPDADQLMKGLYMSVDAPDGFSAASFSAYLNGTGHTSDIFYIGATSGGALYYRPVGIDDHTVRLDFYLKKNINNIDSERVVNTNINTSVDGDSFTYNVPFSITDMNGITHSYTMPITVHDDAPTMTSQNWTWSSTGYTQGALLDLRTPSWSISARIRRMP